MTSFAPTFRATRKKSPQYKRQHKAARLRAVALEQKAIEKAAYALDRSVGRHTARVEAAFRGCEPR